MEYSAAMNAGDWVLVAAVVVSLGIGVWSVLTTKNIQGKQLKHAEKMQENERKNGELSLIISWAIDIDTINKPYEYIIMETGEDWLKVWYMISNHFNLLRQNNNQMLGKGRQMAIFASDFSKELVAAVHKLNVDLGEYGKRLAEQKTWLAEHMTLNGDLSREITGKLSELESFFWSDVDKSAHEVMKESATIMITP